MEFTKSIRGAPKLCYEGYMYTKKKESKTTMTWECTQRRGENCKGTLITDNPPTVVRSTREHCHDGDKDTVEATKLRTDLKKSAKTNRGLPGQILADKMVSQPVEVRVAAGTTETIKRSIRRHRAGNAPGNPVDLELIPFPLPEPYCENVIYDNGSTTSRIVVFASEEGLGLLQNATSWFMDGTHSTAPQQFQQVFTVRVTLGNTSATVAYALLPSKTQEVYEETLTAVLDACLHRDIRPNPTRIVADYEVAIHNAVRSVVASSIHIQEGLQNLYKDDRTIRHFVGMIDGLAFLPEDKVKEGMAHLRAQAPDVLLPIVDYFDSTYVNGGFRSVVTQSGALKFRRTCPRFPIDLWNVHDATMRDEARTNNLCESWNNGFRSLVGHLNPSMWTVIDCFKKDAALVEAEILRVQRGQPSRFPFRKRTQTFQRTLKTLCTQLVNGDRGTTDFLEAVGGHIRLR